MDYIIRRKEIKDCGQIAHVVTVSWNETYSGIVSNDFLETLKKNEPERVQNSISKFDENDNHQFVLEIGNKVVGFINVGPSEEKEYDKCGEIYAIYIMNDYKGKGYGKKLFEAGKNELKSMGFDKMIIGCLKENPSNSFYMHLGGIYIKDRMFERLQLLENVYYYDKI